MGDTRYSPHYKRILRAPDRASALQALTDDEVIQALAAASREQDPYVANVLATEAMNRMRRARTIATNLAEGAFAVDLDLTFTFVNPATTAMLGGEWTDYVGGRMTELLTLRGPDGVAITGTPACPVRRCIREARVIEWEGALARVVGPEVAVSMTVAPIVRDDDVDGAVVAFRRVARGDEDTRRSEARLRGVLAGMREGVLVFDTEGRVLSGNPAAYRLLGRAPEDVVGRFPDEVPLAFADERGARVPIEETPIGLALRARRPAYDAPLRLLTAQGGRDVLLSAVPVEGNGAAATFEDVTDELAERRRAEAALQRSESQYRALVQNSPEPMAVHARGKLRFINEAGARLIGADDPKALLGRDVLDFVHPESLDLVRARLAKLMAGEDGILPAAEERFLRLDGSPIDVETVAIPITYEGEPAVQLIFRDITERKAQRRDLEQRVAERTAELQRALKDLETFSSSASHDLRAPLRGVDALVQDLQEALARGDVEEARDLATRAQRENRRAQRLVQDLLSFARSGKARLDVEDVDVTAVAREVAATLAEANPERRTRWRIEEGLRLEADPSLLRIALHNLMDNASKYASRAAEPTVEVFGGVEDGRPTLNVRDNGVGFPPGEAHRLFQTFARLSTAQGFEGTGLGLATVERVVSRHGGRVWADSRPGETTFHVAWGGREEADA